MGDTFLLGHSLYIRSRKKNPLIKYWIIFDSGGAVSN